MNKYPSIPRFDESLLGKSCIAFYKHDGSNLRVEYTKKRGWYKWGTRGHLFDHTDFEFGSAIEIFHKDFADPLAKIIDNLKIDKLKAERAIVFLEFFGPHSFAGIHTADYLRVESNNPKSLVLFDVNIHRKGIMAPKDFVKHFGHLKIPEIVYQGLITEEFVQNVRESNYSLNEGVVCKGGKGHSLWMCKIKTLDYLRRLKEHFGNDWKKFWE